MTYKLNGYEVTLERTSYVNNNRTALIFYTVDGEPFVDLSENHPEISDDHFFHMPKLEAVIINHNFIDLFPSEREAKVRLRDTLSDLVVITGDIDGWPVLYINN